MASSIVYLAFYILSTSSAYVLLENEDPKESIIWPSEFYFNAEEIDLVNSYIEIYEVWYSGENNRSRIDYYNGTNRVYYIGETDDDIGLQYSFHPISTEEVKNVMVCERDDYEGEQPDFLPSISNYEFLREELQDGKTVRVFTKEAEDEDKDFILLQAELYVYRTDYDFDVPLKQIVKSLNRKNGAIQSHRIRNFKQFSFIVVPEEVTIDDDDCEEAVSADFKALIERLHPSNPVHANKAYHSYKKHHGKSYKPSEDEVRKQIFHENWRKVHAHNSKNLGYKLELNAFADRTEEELMMLTGTLPSSSPTPGSVPFPHSGEDLVTLAQDLPESLDMRYEGVLGPIKNQGACGSCWAFSTTATVEAALSRANGGRNLDLSEQSLVDCAWGFDNIGCLGGQLDKAYEYILKHGIPVESQYGDYIMKDGYCKLENMTETYKIRGFAMVTPRNADAMKVALANYGPVSVALHASTSMKLYSSGVFYDIECVGRKANHGVVVVGYGERDGTPYWIIRNSWGENWGQDGYMLMSALNDNCLVLDTPYYPVV